MINSFNDLESKIIGVHEKLVTKKIDLKGLSPFKSMIQEFAQAIIDRKATPSDKGLYALIMICLDQYTYNDSGEVFISDRDYDILLTMYMANGNEQVIYADTFESSWKMVPHKATWMVGSVKKEYTIKAIEQYIRSVSEAAGMKPFDMEWVISPKFDGVSAVLEFENHKLVQAITRGTRIKGQDITDVLRRASNISLIEKDPKISDGFLKVELCVPKCFFPNLEDAGYKNRRSATTAIVNSPKNLKYAKYIDAIPLLYYAKSGEINYFPKDSVHVRYRKTKELIKIMEDLLETIRTANYEYRVDGVIIYPVLRRKRVQDVMDLSMAYKVNTEESMTTIEYGYVSMGRMGKAVPMIRVKPCDVNETVVTDVSLGSFPIFKTYRLHEKEDVIIYSAGDVIPQMRLPDKRHPNSYPMLKIPEICPYCNEPLNRQYACDNPRCMRLITGRITNFLDKMGVLDISDKTVEALYDAKLIRDICDLFTLTMEEVSRVKGFTEVSATTLVNKIQALTKNPVDAAKLFGSIGVPSVGRKIFSTIFEEMTPDYLIGILDNKNALRFALLNADGIAGTRATIITDFLYEHRSEIKTLLKHISIKVPVKYVANVVMTGFRDAEWQQKFEDIGLRTGSGVTKETLCVIAGDMTTAKAQSALKRGIKIFRVGELEEAFKWCQMMIYESRD